MRISRKSLAIAAGSLGVILAAQAALQLANTPPTVSISSPTAGASLPAGKTVILAASASDVDGRVRRVDFFVDGSRVGYDTSAPFGVNWTRATTGSHTVYAVAKDDRSTTTTSAKVSFSVGTATTPGGSTDTVAPGVPSGLAMTAQNESSISIKWTASADNVGGSGLARYEVFRNGASVGSSTTNAYTDSALAASTGYTYTVRAVDNAGNASAQSAGLVASTTAANVPAALWHRVNGYFTQWGIYNKYVPRNLETTGVAAQLTHLTYAFGNVRNNRCEVGVLKANNASTGEGGDAYADYSRVYAAAESVDGVADVAGAPLRGNWNQLKKLKAKHPGMKVLISLGGWNWSRGFASAARPENRQAFVASCIDAYLRGNLPAFDGAGGAGAAAGVFDGFDIDWEFPAACGVTCGGPEDTDNFTGLLAEFRKQLNAIRPGLELTVAVGGGIDKIRVTRPEQYHQYLDAINLMTYDFHGPWDAKTNFHTALFNSSSDPATGDAALFNTNDAVQAFLSRGVPATKLNIGIASYGRGWTNVGATNHGLFQSGTAAAGSLEPGIERYAVLKALGWPMYTDSSSKSHWIYNGTTFWNFDDPTTIADKTAYVRVQGLAGAFLWDFSGDDTQASLVNALAGGLR
ncbi:glycosyl hydrolase family 18 protein [Cognatilysobacter segetis]|uniref:glycosyl hydrolase family 18 protein n=1 Tax=Cognatilysobacter segetis TaxID=2492394 RepID=UPI00105D1A62|nr:glycosyl hydrolase family 18 protein [Lysobacter segetis]